MAGDDIPEGWGKLPFDTGFIGVNGPLFVRHDGETLRLGFHVEERHCNPMGMCHGGWLASFADMQLPFGARAQAGLVMRFLPTISLSIDYLAPAKLGAWVEGRTEVLKRTQRLVFAQMTATADGEICIRANGTFKIGPEVQFDGGALTALLSRTSAPRSD